MSPSQPTKEFEAAVHEALQLWRQESELAGPLAHLALVRQRQMSIGGNLHRAANQVLTDAIDALAAEHGADAALLRDRFLDGKKVFVVANERNISATLLYKQQRRAMGHLATVLWRTEERASARQRSGLEQRLPAATYTELFGLDTHLAELGEVLLAPQAPWLVSVEGLGGSGKTALAHQLIQQVAQRGARYLDFGWVSAQQQTLHPGGSIRFLGEPALTADALIAALATQVLEGTGIPVPVATERALAALEGRLREAPHLIVVDNLETVTDVETLLPTLARLAGPSKFLLTSREAFPGQVEIYHFPVPELAERDAIALMRAEARLRNLRHVAEASDTDLRPLFDTVGGNPLALRLVTGQLHLLALPQVVENLRKARGKRAEDLYRFIYWDAWQRLPDDARDVLMLMPLFAGDGADLAAISRVSNLPYDPLVQALEYLVRLSLVNIAGDLHHRRYSLHRLTETFLLREVITWQGEERKLWSRIELPDRAHSQDPLANFRHKIAENARAWLGFVRDERPESTALTREFANLNRAAAQALREPTAWAAGVALVVTLWPFIDWRGYWLAWRGILDQALGVCRQLGDLAAEVEITDQLGEVARIVGENRAALAWQEQALGLARRLDDQAVIGRVLVHLSQQHLPQGHYQAAKACCEEAISLLAPLGAEGEVAIAHNNWGIAYSEEGLLDPALAHLMLAEAMFEIQGNRRGQAKALHNQGEAYLRQEHWAEAGPLYERSIAMALESGDEVGAMRSRTSLAILLHQQGQHEAALDLHREIERFYRRLGDRPMLARVINNEGAFLSALGRWDDAALAYEQATQMHRESGNLADVATSLLNWVELLLDQGDAEQAQDRLQQTADLLAALPDPPSQLRRRYATLLGQAKTHHTPNEETPLDGISSSGA